MRPHRAPTRDQRIEVGSFGSTVFVDDGVDGAGVRDVVCPVELGRGEEVVRRGVVDWGAAVDPDCVGRVEAATVELGDAVAAVGPAVAAAVCSGPATVVALGLAWLGREVLNQSAPPPTATPTTVAANSHDTRQRRFWWERGVALKPAVVPPPSRGEAW